MSVLPKEVDYSLVSLPSQVTQQTYVSRALNGSSFGSNQTIQFALVNNKGTYLINDSLYFTCRIRVTAHGADDNSLLGIPAASIIDRSTVMGNSSSLEDINNYGAVVNALLHSKLNVAQKMGMSKPFGTKFTANEANDVDSFGVVAGTGENIIEVSIPLMNCLTSAEKYIPLASAQYLIYLTLADLANFAIKDVDGSTTSLTLFSVDACELHYKAVSFPPEMDAVIMSQVDGAGDIYFKSQSYASSVANIAAGSSGNQNIPFSNSLSSIKSLWCLFCKSTTYKNFASFNITNGAGTIGWTVAGRQFPTQRIDMTQHESNAVLEYLEAIHGTSVSPEVSCSLSTNNFRTINSAYAAGDIKDLGKCYFGVNCERLAGKSYMLTGVSSQNSNISLDLSIDGAATNVSANVVQVFNYDLLLKYTPSQNVLVVLK